VLSLAPITPTAVDIVIIQPIHPIMVALVMAIEEDMAVVTEADTVVDIMDIVAGSAEAMVVFMVVLGDMAGITEASYELHDNIEQPAR
jgi:hypothetical protein